MQIWKGRINDEPLEEVDCIKHLWSRVHRM